MADRVLQVARSFARALDEEDYAAALELLSPSCVYRIHSSTFTGPRAIVDEYRRNGDAAAERLDSIEYESAVRRGGGNTAIITFIDRVRHAGRELVHTCEQVVELDGEGLVNRIEHRDLPGEPEALQAFYRAVGLAGGER